MLEPRPVSFIPDGFHPTYTSTWKLSSERIDGILRNTSLLSFYQYDDPKSVQPRGGRVLIYSRFNNPSPIIELIFSKRSGNELFKILPVRKVKQIV